MVNTEEGIMKKLSIIGSTGSIGTQTLEIVRNNADLEVVALAAGKNIKLLEKQIREFHPEFVSVSDEEDARKLRILISDLDVKVLSGMDGLVEVACANNAEMVVTAVVGMLGIRPTIAAIEAGKQIGLANKETLVCAGHIIMPLAKKCGAQILPVDSEHSAIFQSMNGERHNRVEKILLTASGGPFRGRKRDELRTMKASDALKHPNWSMGNKVTIDSSTLINKGLEVMEAKWLFDVELDQIQVVVHPQSIVHSAVQYEDGAVIAQLGVPDMKLPIQYAIYYPNRRFLGERRLDLFEIRDLTFEAPDTETFYGLKLAYDAMRKGGNLPTIFNAANECAVARFLKDEISFLEIPEIVSDCMQHVTFAANPDVTRILETQQEVMEYMESR